MSYANGLCSLRKISLSYGIHKFSGIDGSFLMGNPALAVPSEICLGVRRKRDTCKKVFKGNKTVLFKKPFMNGPKSQIFSEVNIKETCNLVCSMDNEVFVEARSQQFLSIFYIIEGDAENVFSACIPNVSGRATV